MLTRNQYTPIIRYRKADLSVTLLITHPSTETAPLCAPKRPKVQPPPLALGRNGVRISAANHAATNRFRGNCALKKRGA